MLTAEGVAALLKVKEQKLAAPESLIMSDYLTQERTINRSCIGGQLILNRYGIKKFIEAEKYDMGVHILAASILGISLTVEEAEANPITDELFHVSRWSDDLKDSWFKEEKYSLKRAQIVAEVIDRFISKHYKLEEVKEDA